VGLLFQFPEKHDFVYFLVNDLFVFEMKKK
jgi:hypothetical protein